MGYFGIREGRYFVKIAPLGIVVSFPIKREGWRRLDTTLPRSMGTFIRHLESRLHLQHGVAGKEARCPSKQGEVSYFTSLPFNGNVKL